MFSLDNIGTMVQARVTDTLSRLYRSQKQLPTFVISAVLLLEALQLIALGLVASDVTAVKSSVGLLLVAGRSVASPTGLAALFWAAVS